MTGTIWIEALGWGLLHFAWQGAAWTSTDKDGRFRFDHVDGTAGLSLRAQAPWGNSAWQGVKVGADGVQLRCPTTRPAR